MFEPRQGAVQGATLRLSRCEPLPTTLASNAMPESSTATSAASLPPPPQRYNVLGVGIHALTLTRARDLVLSARADQPRGYVCLCTVHGVEEARVDPGFRAILNASFLTTPDGMPLVWLAPRGLVVERVYGPDLLLAVCDAGCATGTRHFFYGGHPGVAQTLAARLADRFPGLIVAGTYTPPFRPLTPAERTEVRMRLDAAQADVIWVGLGTPKQERFMAELAPQVRAGVFVGIGAAFDFHSGRVRQAPRWMQRRGLEWLFRLCIEPRRLGWRYLRTNPVFLLRAAAQRLRLKHYPLP